MMGVGLLSLPFALKSSGWIGILLLWVMGFVTNYTGAAASCGGHGGVLPVHALHATTGAPAAAA